MSAASKPLTLDERLEAILRERTGNLPRTLERMKRMIARLGIRFDCPVLTVAGTNGKGSTCAYLEAVLRAGGMKTAMHTSPHLLRFAERCRINGRPVEDDVLAAALDEVGAAKREEGLPLTYFEETGLAIFLTMMREKPEVAILEIGVGAHYDAVNAVDPSGSIITTVDLDHTAWLGTTREAVGAEKAWVYRPGRPAVCADPNPPESVGRHAEAIGAKLCAFGRDYDVCVHDDGTWDFRFFGADRFNNSGASSEPLVYSNLPQPALFGSAQYRNAAGALALLSAVRAAGEALRFDEAAVAQALRSVELPGRFMTAAEDPCPIIVDVAHNPEAARQLAQNLRDAAAPGQTTLAVFAMLADKDRAAAARAVAPLVDDWFVAGLGGERGTSARENAAVLGEAGVPQERIRAFEAVREALRSACLHAKALRAVDPKRPVRIVAFGSFHTVEAVIEALSAGCADD